MSTMLGRLFTYVVLGIAAITKVRGQAGSISAGHIAVHKVLSSPGGVFKFPDGREISAKIYNVGGCKTFPALSTGSAFPSEVGNYTAISYQAEFGNDECLVKGVGDFNLFDSAQVITVKANGWEMTPSNINLDDIDSQTDVRPGAEWREAAAIFGMRNDEVVLPDVGISSDSLLKVEDYTFPKSAFDEIDIFSPDNVMIKGSRYAPASDDLLYNCPDDPRLPNAGKCRSVNKFSTPVDTLVFVYGVSKKSPSDPHAVAFMSEIHLPIGCLCSKKGKAKVMVPIPGSNGMCSKRESVGEAFICDFMGRFWCETEDTTGYQQSGPCTESRCPCTAFSSKNTFMLTSYNPTAKS